MQKESEKMRPRSYRSRLIGINRTEFHSKGCRKDKKEKERVRLQESSISLFLMFYDTGDILTIL